MLKFIKNLFHKNKGCLYVKTQQEKEQFFESLQKFYKTDYIFFKEQFDDLLIHEQNEFIQYVKKRNQQLNEIKQLIDVISQLTSK